MKKLFPLLLLFLAVLPIHAQQQSLSSVKGKVTHDGQPLLRALITSQQLQEEVQTDENGFYRIASKEGDKLTFSYPGMRDVEIIVEDITSILNIEMNMEVTQLEEVVVEKTRLRTQKQLRGEYRTNKNLINTAFGIRDKETASFSMKIIEGKALPLGAFSLASVLQGRVSGLRVEFNPLDPTCPTIYLRGAAGVGFIPAIYDVDGLIFTQPPCFVMVENIERVAVMRGLGLVNRYGFQANGGVIAINTKGGSFHLGRENGKPYDQAKLRNNIFEGDAISKSQVSRNAPNYIKELRAAETESEAIDIYRSQATAYSSSYQYALDAYVYFLSEWNNVEMAETVLGDFLNIFGKNPVALKALAYVYQAGSEYQKANDIYKKLFVLRPSYAQSYRDLAVSYRQIGEFKKAATLYARYDYLVGLGYIRGEDKGFTPLIQREFQNLLELHQKELTDFQPANGMNDEETFRGTRLVFEWNDSEAEFELQFVNPDNQYYKWEHSLLASADRIKDEKLKGYSSEEYLIDDSLKGLWRVNVNYFGNKRLTPTYLKATIYHNYGTANQYHEIKVFKLSVKDVNQELFAVSNAKAMVSR